MSQPATNLNSTSMPASIFVQVKSARSGGCAINSSHVLMGGEIQAHLPADGTLEFRVSCMAEAIDFQARGDIELNRRREEDGVFILEPTKSAGTGMVVIRTVDANGNASTNQVTGSITISAGSPVSAQYIQPRL